MVVQSFHLQRRPHDKGMDKRPNSSKVKRAPGRFQQHSAARTLLGRWFIEAGANPVVVTTLACCVPAHRASGNEPTAALRYE
jgi:ABC-type lipoprotein release transport system permease subunit